MQGASPRAGTSAHRRSPTNIALAGIRAPRGRGYAFGCSAPAAHTAPAAAKPGLHRGVHTPSTQSTESEFGIKGHSDGVRQLAVGPLVTAAVEDTAVISASDSSAAHAVSRMGNRLCW